jgi:hypothetical protein
MEDLERRPIGGEQFLASQSTAGTDQNPRVFLPCISSFHSQSHNLHVRQNSSGDKLMPPYIPHPPDEKHQVRIQRCRVLETKKPRTTSCIRQSVRPPYRIRASRRREIRLEL